MTSHRVWKKCRRSFKEKVIVPTAQNKTKESFVIFDMHYHRERDLKMLITV